MVFYYFVSNPFENKIAQGYGGGVNSDLPLKNFGCTVYVHIPSKFRSKLDLRAEKCVFIGYAPNERDTSVIILKHKKCL